jgi:hypothetical protein
MTPRLFTLVTHLTAALLLLVISGSSAPAEDVPQIFFGERPALLVRARGGWMEPYLLWKVEGRWQSIAADELPSDIRRQIQNVAPAGKPSQPREGERR